MAKICQLHADLHYFLCMEPVDMRKQFRGLQGIISEKYNRYLTQDEKWIAKYNEVTTFIETNHRNPSMHDEEEREVGISTGSRQIVKR